MTESESVSSDSESGSDGSSFSETQSESDESTSSESGSESQSASTAESGNGYLCCAYRYQTEEKFLCMSDDNGSCPQVSQWIYTGDYVVADCDTQCLR